MNSAVNGVFFTLHTWRLLITLPCYGMSWQRGHSFRQYPLIYLKTRQPEGGTSLKHPGIHPKKQQTPLEGVYMCMPVCVCVHVFVWLCLYLLNSISICIVRPTLRDVAS